MVEIKEMKYDIIYVMRIIIIYIRGIKTEFLIIQFFPSYVLVIDLGCDENKFCRGHRVDVFLKI